MYTLETAINMYFKLSAGYKATYFFDELMLHTYLSYKTASAQFYFKSLPSNNPMEYYPYKALLAFT